MKKVFLVYACLYYKSGFRSKVLLYAFASAKKAKVYAHYKSLQVVRKGAHAVFGVPGASDIIEDVNIIFKAESISTIDWSSDLKALQDESL